MEIKINGKEFYFGKKPKIPKRETNLVYYDNGYSINRLNATMNKEMSERCLRRFAQTPVVRRAINITKNTLLNCEWVIEKKDMNSDVDLSNEIQVLTECLENPNHGDNFRSLFGAVIEDILTGDCGAIEVCECANPVKPIWLYPVDGFTIQVCTQPVSSPKDIKYKQMKADGGTVELASQDLMYFNLNNFTHTPLGLSPVESAFTIINYLLNTQKYAGFATSNAIPKYMINLGENCDNNQLIAFRKYFDEEVVGTGKTPIVGGSNGIKAEQIGARKDDELYLQWQHFLIAIIAYTFNIDPKRLNEGSQTDRSTVDEQKENILDEAVKPLAHVIEANINTKILKRLGLDNLLVFRFKFEDNETRKKHKTDRILSEFNADILTLNEARQLLGYSVLDKDYGEMLKSEYKTQLNIEYSKETQNQSAGGFNGVGKDRYDGGESAE